MEKDLFTFHKKKSSLINKYQINNKQKDLGENQELLFFQKWHDKNINSYNNFMKRKSLTIEANTRNYLKFISYPNINNNLSKSINQNYYNSLKENIDFNINDFSKLNHCNNILKMNNKEIDKKALNFNLKKNPSEKDIFKKRYELALGKVKYRRSDITNPSYFNEVGEEIINFNKDVMNYNIKEAEKKFNKKKLHKNDDISLSPEKIHNLNYYNIGESSLNVNPIINKGSYFQKELKYSKKYNGRKKTDIMTI